MFEAHGIHAHPYRKTGLRPPSNRPALHLADVLTGTVPPHPATADHLADATFGLYENDKFGDCGPTAVANLRRLITTGLTGTMQAPTQDDVFDLYRRSGNPDFNPTTGAGDNGVDMQTMLEALLAGGIGGVKPLAFAKVDVSSDSEMTAAISIFGGLLWGVDLDTAQQSQTDNGEWTYVDSPEWGGHAVLAGAYEAGSLEDVETWALRVKTTSTFRQRQLQEAWVVIWQESVDHPAFQAGVDLEALAVDYADLTGSPFPAVVPPAPAPVPPAPTPVPVPPVPTPTPVPSSLAKALWADLQAAWKAAQAWAKAEGL